MQCRDGVTNPPHGLAESGSTTIRVPRANGNGVRMAIWSVWIKLNTNPIPTGKGPQLFHHENLLLITGFHLESKVDPRDQRSGTEPALSTRSKKLNISEQQVL